MKVILFGGCVIGDTFHLGRFEVVAHIGRTAFSSAFAHRRFHFVDQQRLKALAEADGESAWSIKSTCRDLDKQARPILRQNSYDAIIIDYLGECRSLIALEGRRAAMTEAFWPYYLAEKTQPNHPLSKAEQIGMCSLRRLIWWRKGVRNIVKIAKKKKVPIILPLIYPATHNERGQDCSSLPLLKQKLWLALLYCLTPRYIKKISVPKKYRIIAMEHKWGGSIAYHYIPQYYEWLEQSVYHKLKKWRRRRKLPELPTQPEQSASSMAM
ncbi:MAG: hypothetical protein DU429_06715 [Candidatus Tokpelaia sp.]|nr:MAG: hypothetical protein DU430_07150 [Candidatus Tokpelaia sp.]KAA6206110.1 MAG: hypothetical protein DU429_06715 [Candidatus Tokpelaia sp.]